MDTTQFFPLGEGLELTQMERHEDQLVLHVTATKPCALCPLCQQPATHLHSRYRRVVKDLPCAGQRVRLILHVRTFFCETADCVRKVFAERLPHLAAPWAQMTTRLSEALQTIGLATCGKLGARLASHLGIITSWMTVVRRVMALPTPPVEHVECLGVDDFSFRRGRTFGTVVVDLDAHQIIDLLPDRQADSAAAWMAAHPEITHVSRDRGAEYASVRVEDEVCRFKKKYLPLFAFHTWKNGHSDSHFGRNTCHHSEIGRYICRHLGGPEHL